MDKKKVLIISSPDINNAAGVIAYDLHFALCGKYSSEIIVMETKCKAPGLISYYSRADLLLKRITKKIKNLFHKVDKPLMEENYYFFNLDLKKNFFNHDKFIKKVSRPDIIIAYLMQDFFSVKDIFDLHERFKVPVILMMADMIFMTGGCHYAWDCEGYKKDCSNCPAILDTKINSIATTNLMYNRKLIEKMNVQVVVPCVQDFEGAKQSTMFKDKDIHFVLEGINMDIFFYKNKLNELRKKYGVNEDDFVILFGATSIGEKRKGVKYFIEAIKILHNELKVDNITIVSIGKGDLKELLHDISYKILNLGYISGYHNLADVYNLSNVFVTTTIQDSGPMMVNQSIACGTPVVCFDHGVAKSVVINGKTGYKSEMYNSKGISNSLKLTYLKDNHEFQKIREACYKLAKDNFSLEVVAFQIEQIIEKQIN